MINFASCCHDSDFHLMERENCENRLFPTEFFHMIHLLFLDHQRNDTHSYNLISLFHREIAMSGCKHDLTERIYFIQFLAIDLQKAVALCSQFDLSFFRLRCIHMLSLADLAQHLCRIIFMKHAFLLLPYIEVFFSYRKQYRNVLFCHYMSFTEDRILHNSRNNLGNVVAKHTADRILCSD